MADLITLAQYKTAKGLVSSNEDAKITPLLASVSQLVRTYCGREFTTYYSSDKTEYFSIFWGENFVQLSEFPLVSITSVSERNSLTDSYVPITNYYPEDSNIYKIGDDGITASSFSAGPGSVKVVYKGGYQNIPEDLKQACIDLVTYYLKEEYKINRSIGSTTMQNASQASTPHSAELPAHIKRVLDLYRVI